MQLLRWRILYFLHIDRGELRDAFPVLSSSISQHEKFTSGIPQHNVSREGMDEHAGGWSFGLNLHLLRVASLV